MINKHRKRLKGRSTDELFADGIAQTSAGNHRDALEIYRELYRRNADDRERHLLQDTYLARITQLAEKRMDKEAAVLWENMAQLDTEPPRKDLYLACLLNSGQHAKAIRVYQDSAEELFAQQGTEILHSMIAAVTISGKFTLAENTTVAQHGHIMRHALHAYCQSDNTATESYLRHIPFRSPFRDLCVILKGALRLESQPEDALALLNKVTEISPFYALSSAFKTNLSNADEMMAALSCANPVTKNFFAERRGVNTDTLNVIEKLTSASRKRDTKTLFKIAISKQNLFGKQAVDQFCKALLPFYPSGLKLYEKLFSPLPPFEQLRFQALSMELRDEIGKALHAWEECITWLLTHSTANDKQLMAALILRHMTQFGDLDAPLPRDLLRDLERSLKLDPADKETLFKVIEHYAASKENKKRQHWVDNACQQFPGDADVMHAAVTLAIDKKAYKKAATLAKTALKKDPINRRLRHTLISSHLAHARRLIFAKKYTLAAKELNSAADFEQRGQQNGVIKIYDGLLAILEGRNTDAKVFFDESLLLNGCELITNFRCFVEAKRLKLNLTQLKPFRTALKKQKNQGDERNQLLTLLAVAKEYIDEPDKNASIGANQALQELTSWLNKAASADLAEKELSSICDTFYRVRNFRLLKLFGNAGKKRWKNKPIFIFYAIFGHCEGSIYKLSEKHINDLVQAADTSMNNDDVQTTERISRFIEPAMNPFARMPSMPFGPNKSFDQFLEEIIDSGALPDLADFPDDLIDDLLPPPRPKKQRSKSKSANTPDNVPTQGDFFDDQPF